MANQSWRFGQPCTPMRLGACPADLLCIINSGLNHYHLLESAWIHWVRVSASDWRRGAASWWICSVDVLHPLAAFVQDTEDSTIIITKLFYFICNGCMLICRVWLWDRPAFCIWPFFPLAGPFFPLHKTRIWALSSLVGCECRIGVWAKMVILSVLITKKIIPLRNLLAPAWKGQDMVSVLKYLSLSQPCHSTNSVVLT